MIGQQQPASVNANYNGNGTQKQGAFDAAVARTKGEEKFTFGQKPVQERSLFGLPLQTSGSSFFGDQPQNSSGASFGGQQINVAQENKVVSSYQNAQAPVQNPTPACTSQQNAQPVQKTAANSENSAHSAKTAPAPRVSPSMDEIERKARTISLGDNPPQNLVHTLAPTQQKVYPAETEKEVNVLAAQPATGSPKSETSGSISNGTTSSSNTTPSVASEKKKNSSSAGTATTNKRGLQIFNDRFEVDEVLSVKPKNAFSLFNVDNLAVALMPERVSLKPVNIHELSTLLSFEQAREYFPWIGVFHPQGKLLHPSLPYLAVVFNELGCWNKEHVLLLASNEDLSEQMHWEIRVALLFKNESTSQYELNSALSSIPRDEAMMIIALRTAKASHEVVLAPSPVSDLTGVKISYTIEKIKEWAILQADIVKSRVEDSKARCDKIQALLELAGLPEKEFWNHINLADKQLLNDLVKARVLLWQLDNLVVHVSPYTGLVHVKTTRWEPSFYENHTYHPLVEFVPHLQEYLAKTLDFGGLTNCQYENLQKFLCNVEVETEIEGTPRSLVFNSLEQPQDYIPFELFFTYEQRGQTINFMRTISGIECSFHFVAPPAAINNSKTYYSLEGIITYKTLWYHSHKFHSNPITLSLSDFKHYLSRPLSKSKSKHSPRRIAGPE